VGRCSGGASVSAVKSADLGLGHDPSVTSSARRGESPAGANSSAVIACNFGHLRKELPNAWPARCGSREGRIKRKHLPTDSQRAKDRARRGI